MDLGEILFLLVLFALPVLEQLFSHWRGARRPPPPPAEPETGAAPPAEKPRLRVEPVGGWGDWTVALPESEAGAPEEIVDEEEAAARAPRAERARVPEEPEAERVAVQVVSLEPLQVDRPAEHVRFHRTLEAPALRRPARRAPRLAAALADRDDVRRAVLLAEVIGPPKGLQ